MKSMFMGLSIGIVAAMWFILFDPGPNFTASYINGGGLVTCGVTAIVMALFALASKQ